MKRIHAIAGLLVAILPVFFAPAWSEEAAPQPTAAQAEVKAAFEAVRSVLQRGPLEILLAGQGKLSLPEGFAFIRQAEATRLMRAMGNSVDGSFQGMIVPHVADSSFSFYDVSFQAAGYIKDDDAKDWKADELLQQVREGTEQGNKRRAEMGIGELEVTGWIEPPHYQADRHQLVWSIGARNKGAPAGEAEGVNYRTLVLGREGYIAMTLVTDRAHIDTLRPATAALLDSLHFEPGKQYGDFNSSTDHVAEFGLAALVAGVAAKKIGLLALGAAFVLKFAKLIVIGVAGIFWALRKKLGFGSRKEPAPPPVLGASAPLSAPGLPPDAPGQEPKI